MGSIFFTIIIFSLIPPTQKIREQIKNTTKIEELIMLEWFCRQSPMEALRGRGLSVPIFPSGAVSFLFIGPSFGQGRDCKVSPVLCILQAFSFKTYIFLKYTPLVVDTPVDDAHLTPPLSITPFSSYTHFLHQKPGLIVDTPVDDTFRRFDTPPQGLMTGSSHMSRWGSPGPPPPPSRSSPCR